MHLSTDTRTAYRPPAVQANTPVRSEKRFKWWDYLIFAGLTVLNGLVISYAIVYWLARLDWNNQATLSILIGLTFLFNVGMWLSRWLMLPLMRVPRPIAPADGWRVGVATTFVPGFESIEMLEETVHALVAMQYPHDTWVLDEGDDDEVKALCARLGARYFTRKHLLQYQTDSGAFKARTKYGNYNAWLHAIGFHGYDIVAGFDSDHIPLPGFLANVLGYFDDGSIGYVQTAQAYYNQNASFIARGAAEETYAYFSSIQMTSYAMGYPIVTGCHNTHRVTALKQVGGFSAHDADDLLISILYRAEGWHGIYLPKILARGLTPVDWNGYLSQQRRWARSTLDLKFRVYPHFALRLPLAERVMSFIHGFYYLRSIITALQIGLLVYMLATGDVPGGFSQQLIPPIATVALAMFACDMYRQRFFLNWKAEWGLHWRAMLLEYAKWPYFLMALYDILMRYRGPYTVTPKNRTSAQQISFAIPHLLVIGLIGAAWAIGMLLGHAANSMLLINSALVIGASVAVAATTYLRFPGSYDPAMRATFDENKS